MNEEDIKQLQEEVDAKNAEIERLQNEKSKNESNQNSYITKLEGELKGLRSTLEQVKETATNPGTTIDPELVQYFKDKRKEDVLTRSYALLEEKVGKFIFDQLKEELASFLEQTFNTTNTHEAYVLDAFNLIYGRALTSGTIELTEEVKEEGEGDGETGGMSPTDILKSYKDTPPIMTSKDTSASSDQPGSQPQVPTVQNTDEAMKRFKEKFLNLNNDKFN